ncbi:CPBP family glutamic-type intramembrane protease [Haloplasma contractile]|uniref:CAAX protease self-immunity protein n=1 Tax=Haloplasma contractile SSD-17B TaxID=1033810 RepID=U2FL69_9MOLU|nr:CPBP family glutamic-type intramembrane protease [Haloplasma contractile]ERJ11949.1 CAAX protease self-immunity protein [Haloplasma contractile SSD-17B]
MIKKQKYINWSMVVSRLILFISIQSFIAFIFNLLGKDEPWIESTKWWPVVVLIANIIGIILLSKLFRQEGKSFWSLFRIQTDTLKKDLINSLVIIILLGPIAFIPNVLLATIMFDDPMIAMERLIHPLPLMVAIISGILFSITQGLAEIPVYFSYVMPKLRERGYSKWTAIIIPSLFLGIQHIGVPLMFDLNYLVWRGFMYLPLALFFGIIMYRKPRLLPYLAIIHVLMDLSFAMMLIAESY